MEYEVASDLHACPVLVMPVLAASLVTKMEFMLLMKLMVLVRLLLNDALGPVDHHTMLSEQVRHHRQVSLENFSDGVGLDVGTAAQHSPVQSLCLLELFWEADQRLWRGAGTSGCSCGWWWYQ